MLRVLKISQLEKVPIVEESYPDVYLDKKILKARAKREIEFRLDCGLTLKDLGKVCYFLDKKGLDSNMLVLTTAFYDPHFYGEADHVYNIKHRQMSYDKKLELIQFLESMFPSIKIRRVDSTGTGLKYG